MPFTKQDLKEMKNAVIEAVNPYFTAIQKDFGRVYERFDRIEEWLERAVCRETGIKLEY